MQTYLCVVHPIYQEDEQALQAQTKRQKERERGGERGQSCYSCFLPHCSQKTCFKCIRWNQRQLIQTRRLKWSAVKSNETREAFLHTGPASVRPRFHLRPPQFKLSRAHTIWMQMHNPKHTSSSHKHMKRATRARWDYKRKSLVETERERQRVL